MASNRPRLLLTAPASGGGKTTVTLGLLQALLARDMRPAAFKCGPDYIDPLFHREVLGAGGYNLDLYFASREVVRGLLVKGSAEADVAVLEGVMGYYDGIAAGDEASSWQVATATETPAVMVLRPQGAFLSLAALLKGFCDFRENSGLRGIILNRCGEGYYEKLAPMLEKETGLSVYGFLPELKDAALSSRHLGLVTPNEVSAFREKLALLGEAFARTVDVDGLLRLAAQAPDLHDKLPKVAAVTPQPVKVAVAKDEAFCFYYRENLELLEQLGLEPVFFSPLHDAALPRECDALYLGGGYPELHAEALSRNTAMRDTIAVAVRRGMPTLAECGGFLYLQNALHDESGAAHPMVGALPGQGKRAGGLRRFGYVELVAWCDTVLVARGKRIRGHEFHYWDSDVCGESCSAVKPGGGGEWECVQSTPALFAGFPHLYLWSNPSAARRFVQAVVHYRTQGADG